MRLIQLLLLLVLSSCAGPKASVRAEQAPPAGGERQGEEASTPPSAGMIQGAALLDEAERLLTLNDPEGALAHLRQAEAEGIRIPSFHLYNASFAASLSGLADESVEWLRKAIDAGFEDLSHIKNDPDMEPIRQHPEYLAQIARLEARLAHQDGPLRDELVRMAAEDQEVRHSVTPDDIGKKDAPVWKRMGEVDAKNTARLKDLIVEKGWPGISQVGREGARAAWILAQHADQDPAFQREVLGLMEVALERGDAERALFALLTDRVLLAEGKPQRYGTQLTPEDGTLRPRPVEDPAQLPSLRAKMGLPELTEYLRFSSRQMGNPPYSVEPLPQAAAK